MPELQPNRGLTFSTAFTGFGLCDQGFEAAGLTPLNHFEICPRLAEIGQANTRGKYVVGDICETDWSRYEAPDHFHASPICTRASVANPNAEESPLDLATAAATMRAVETWKPQTFTLENVWGYRTFQAFRFIEIQLERLGYHFDFWHLNSADYGVPQTRKRLILCARLQGPRPQRPEPTHAKEPIENLFGCLEHWRGWYEAIEDLIPHLPESAFAPWQLARMGDLMPQDTFLHMTGASSSNPETGGTGIREIADPTATVSTRSERMATAFVSDEEVLAEWNDRHDAAWNRAAAPRCLLVSGGQNDSGTKVTYREGAGPAFTITAQEGVKLASRAFIVEGSAFGVDNAYTLPIRAAAEPVFTMRAQQNNPRAFLVERHGARSEGNIIVRDEMEPCWTLRASERNSEFANASTHSGRVVAMTPRALARFQSLPDNYELSGNRKLDCTGIGNGWPSLMAQRVIESLV